MTTTVSATPPTGRLAVTEVDVQELTVSGDSPRVTSDSASPKLTPWIVSVCVSEFGCAAAMTGAGADSAAGWTWMTTAVATTATATTRT